MSLFVERPGLLTTVQDLGRYGAQKYGVIVSGAVDRLALRIANLLVGNEEGEAGLEITIIGPELAFERTALISICGANLSPELDGKSVPLWKTIMVPAGSRLKFGKARQGCRSYVAIGGGLDLPAEMNSRSTYLRAKLGGYLGRALETGDRIALREPSSQNKRLLHVVSGHEDEDGYAASPWSVSHDLIPPYQPEPTVQATAGQEYELFDEESRHRFFHEPFTILPQSDRMGYRLKGSPLLLREQQEMISSAVTFGTVQVPSDGNPIVLMADHQTTGGYPKIAQVISADLPLLAQANLGGKVSFRLVSLREAQQTYVAQQLALQTLRRGMEQMAHS
ncbi:biotin-dependent carboxyltransferase family protein [Paenibacillus ginsengarvi]|uniref:Biotin-dependent carboxyltransferase n=1 Tax=Paenibacillus ginsengarvi TaxID=400777 RepID=A0A3B0C113_9BACL|nr:biotin-dependent carboxyltransferase family protein [Paenibacillus ginsengarvi]RKN78278.1 biotin-dependent carboxyltransferase [Paenibacillus ginsengarvi]